MSEAVPRRDPVETARTLERWLGSRLDTSSVVVSDLSIPKAGFSNETILGLSEWNDAGGDHSVEFALRIQPTAHQLFVTPDALRQARVMSALAGHVPVPPIWLTETDTAVLGAPFFLMQRVHGRIPGDVPSWHQKGWVFGLEADDQRRLHDAGLDTLARLHEIDTDQRQFGFLETGGEGTQLERYVAHLATWKEWCTPVIRYDADVIDAALDYLTSETPADDSRSVMWGDARMGNIIFADDLSVAAMLDWEGAALGPPELDVAWWVMFDEFLCETQGLQRLPGVPDRRGTFERYEQASGHVLRDVVYYEVLAGLQLALINSRLADLLISTRKLPESVASTFVTRVTAMTRPRPRPGDRMSSMPNPIELVVDVTDAVAIGEPAHTAATVYLPDGELADPAVVCFAFPGGGYSRRYFALDATGYEPGGQAKYHTDRGWIFVACDHLGFGDSTVPVVDVLDYDNIALGNLVTVETVLAKLRDGELGDHAVADPVKLGIGQSMGGCFALVLQGRHAPFDGLGVLGYSAIHTIVPSRPGTPPAVWPWIARGADLADPKPYNAAAMAAAAGPLLEGEESLRATVEAAEHPFAWSFHYDDVDPQVVAEDLYAGTDPGKPLPSWRSASTPACGIYMVAPGTVALEAASITAPVLSATGERDVVPDPWMEPKAFKSCSDISVYVCPRMGHMHNFASTRQQFWQRIHSWGSGVAGAVRRG